MATLVRDVAGSVELIIEVRDIRAEQGWTVYLALHCLYAPPPAKIFPQKLLLLAWQGKMEEV